jgi:hypothetical protein
MMASQAPTQDPQVKKATTGIIFPPKLQTTKPAMQLPVQAPPNPPPSKMHEQQKATSGHAPPSQTGITKPSAQYPVQAPPNAISSNVQLPQNAATKAKKTIGSENSSNISQLLASISGQSHDTTSTMSGPVPQTATPSQNHVNQQATKAKPTTWKEHSDRQRAEILRLSTLGKATKEKLEKSLKVAEEEAAIKLKAAEEEAEKNLKDAKEQAEKKFKEVIQKQITKAQKIILGLGESQKASLAGAKSAYDHNVEALKNQISALSNLNHVAVAQENRQLSKQLTNLQTDRKEIGEKYVAMMQEKKEIQRVLNGLTIRHEVMSKENERLQRISNTFEPRQESWKVTEKMWTEGFEELKASFRKERRANAEEREKNEASRVEEIEKWEARVVHLQNRLHAEQAKDNVQGVTEAYQESDRRQLKIEELEEKLSSAADDLNEKEEQSKLALTSKETEHMKAFAKKEDQHTKELARKEETSKLAIAERDAEILKLLEIIKGKDKVLAEKDAELSVVEAFNASLHERLNKKTNETLEKILSTPPMSLPTLNTALTSVVQTSSEAGALSSGHTTPAETPAGDDPVGYAPVGDPPSNPGTSTGQSSPEDGTPPDNDPGDDGTLTIVPVLFPGGMSLLQKLLWYIFAFFRLLYSILVFFHILPHKVGITPLKYAIPNSIRMIGIFLNIAEPKPLTARQVWILRHPDIPYHRQNRPNKKKHQPVEEQEQECGEDGLWSILLDGLRVFAILWTTFMPALLFLADQYDQHLKEIVQADMGVETSNWTVSHFEVPGLNVPTESRAFEPELFTNVPAESGTIEAVSFIDVIVKLDVPTESRPIEAEEEPQASGVNSKVLVAAAIIIVVGVTIYLNRWL